MHFRPYETIITTRDTTVRVRIMPDAFLMLWGEGVGPQDEVGLFAANRELFVRAVADKLIAGETGVVVIGEADIG